MVASNIWTQWAVWLVAASASKRASNTPARLRRQKRFQTEFQLPNSAGSARHVMVWTQKECSAPGTYGRFGLCRLGASTQPETPEPPSPSPRPSSALAWSAFSKPTSQEADIQSAGNQLRNLLAPIRPQGLAVWMRDLLGVGDDTERAGKSLWVRRLGERVGQLWLGGQALAQDYLG